MTVTVPVRRPIVSPTRAVIGAPVAAPGQWNDVAHAAHWCKGKGAQLVSACFPNEDVKNTSEQIYRFKAKPRTSALERIWQCTVEITGLITFAETTVEIRCPATTGTVQYATATTASGWQLISYVEPLVARDDTEQEISIGITIPGATASGGVLIKTISCHEQDRPTLLEDSTDLPVSIETVRTGEPMGVGTLGTWLSIGGVMNTLAAMDARRVGIYHFAAAQGVSNASSTPASVLNLGAYIQAPKLTIGSTTTQVRWAAYASMASGGAAGAVTIATSGSAVSDSVSVPATGTAGWIDGGLVSILCDDFTQDDGQVDDLLTFTITGDSGVRSVTLYALSMWVESVA